MQQRIEFIDLAKGICIILVVLLHIVPSANIPELRFIRIPLYPQIRNRPHKMTQRSKR